MRRVDTPMKVLVRSLIRWSWLLIVCLIVGVGVGKLLTVLLPPTYQSTAYVLLNAQTRASQVQIIQPVAVYATDVTSDAVLNPVLAKHKQIQRANFIAKQLVVTSDGASQTVQIQVTIPGAKLSAEVANELAQSLVTVENASIKAQYNEELQLLTTRIANEQKQIDQLSQQYDNTPTTSTNVLTQLDNQIQQERTLQNNDVTTQQELQTEQALYGSPLIVARSATIAPKPSSITGLIPLTPVMAILFFIIGLVTMAFLEQGAGHINEPHSVQQKLAVPVLGTLRWTHPMALQQLCESHSSYAEDCRMMMADVLFQAETEKAHILAITGTRSKAGTSTAAAELAVLLAQSRRPVLLIDANMHEPSIHEWMNIPNDAGLALLLEEARTVRSHSLGISNHGLVELADRMPLDNFIKPTPFPGLYVLPAGHPKSSPSDLLSMSEMGQFLKWASKPVDFIIIDCPALDRSEAHVLSTLSDQVIIVVDATKDRLKPILNLKNELTTTGIKLAGLVLNKLGRWI